jgi:phage shock protein E
MSNTHISLEDFYSHSKNLGPKDVILDVRNPGEFADGHIEGALNIPVTELEQRGQELKDYYKIYIHCKAGGRANMAYEALRAQGYQNLVCLSKGGMDSWAEKGYPVKSS